MRRSVEVAPVLCLLGPVQWETAAGRVDLGAVKQRTVLAALAVEAGRLVTWTELVDRVWDQASATGSRGALYTYANRIRRLLEAVEAAADDGGPARLACRSGGYLLHLDPDQVDLHRFHRLTAAAEDAGRPDGERARLLSEALSLWQGRPLADLPGQWAAGSRETWGRQRLKVVVAWAEARVRLGEPDGVIGPVEELTVEYPLAEPLTGVLIRALAVAGRDAEALHCYAAYRTRLIEELGAEPGPQLRRLHEAVLRGTVSHSRRAPETLATEADRPVPPRQLPAGVRHFVGRLREQQTLSGLLDEAAAGNSAVVISAISGTAGVGKTALAVHWAHRVRRPVPRRAAVRQPARLRPGRGRHGPGGGDPRVPRRPRRARRADPGRPGRPGRRCTAACWPASACWSCWTTPATPSRSARCCPAPRAPSCWSPAATSSPAWSPARRPPADPGPAHLGTRPGSCWPAGSAPTGWPPSRTRSTRSSADCARLPLALAIVAARAATHPELPLAALADAATEQRTPAGRARRRRPRHRRPGGVLLVLPGAQPGRGPAVPAARPAPRPGHLRPPPRPAWPACSRLAVQPLLAELARAHLLDRAQPGRYSLHDLLRAYAAELATGARRRRTTGEPPCTGCSTTTCTPPTPPTDCWIRPEARSPSPRQAQVSLPRVPSATGTRWPGSPRNAPSCSRLSTCAGGGFDTHTWQLGWTLAEFLDRRGHWHDLEAVGNAALAAARRLGDPMAEARAHRCLGHAYRSWVGSTTRRTNSARLSTCSPSSATRSAKPTPTSALPRRRRSRVVTGRPSRTPGRLSSCSGRRPARRGSERAQRGRLVPRPARRSRAGSHRLPGGPHAAPGVR